MSPLSLNDKLLQELVQKGKLSAQDRSRLLGQQQETGKLLSEVLVEEKILNENEMVHLLSDSLDLPILRLSAYQVDPKVLRLIPQELAERYAAVPIAKIGSILTLATSRPPDLMALDDIRGLTHCEIRWVLATPTEIQNALATNYMGSAVLTQVLKDAEPEDAVELIAQDEGERLEEAVDEAPVIRMVNHIIQEAFEGRASDIHLEPYQDQFRIRYRIDGVLKEAFQHSMEIYSALIARIKILSNLDITEKRLPQDGRFKALLGEKEIDFRVSILPTFFGEKGVLRLLDKANVRSGLDELGFSSKSIEAFKAAVRHPYGMILVTGPTGSGKSTTLYSVLNLLNTPDRNLMTIEDPVEYQIEGITQTQVNPEIGLTFVSGLRSLLRQSPDVILVGEIRDGETADIAVKAALTGHLVLSTLHTNSAAGAVTRLVDMGVEPFLISSSIILVAGQRLLRQICSYCKAPFPLPPEILKQKTFAALNINESYSFKGKGCKRCNQTGYRGRLGAIEVLLVDGEIRQAILDRSSSDEIEKMVRKKGMETLFENAIGLFKEGKTTLEEVFRVTATE